MSDALSVHLVAGFPSPAHCGLVRELRRLATVWVPDHPRDAPARGACALVLPPHVEPGPLVEAWSDPAALEAWVGRPARLRGTTVVLDAERLGADLRSQDRLADRSWAAHPGDGRSVADLLVEQVEAADRVVITGPQRGRFAPLLRALNPYAPCVDARGVAAGLRDERALQLPWPRASWRRACDGLDLPADAPPAFVYRRRRPFEPVRFAHWMANPASGVVRAKGRIWVLSRPDVMLGYSRAGAFQRAFVAARWWAARPPGSWPRSAGAERTLLARWDVRFGDRHQEIVFVGPDLEPARIEARLDECLATDQELRASVDLAPNGAWEAGRPELH